MIIAATGHRPQKLGREWTMEGPYSNWIRMKMQEVIDQYKPAKMISGMALGVDTIWALLAIKNQIPLTAAIPFIGQENRWRHENIQMYKMLISHPLCTVVNVSGEKIYRPDFMQKRNIWMVDNSDLLVAVYDGSVGGTDNCYRYAWSKGREIHRIDPNGWRKT